MKQILVTGGAGFIGSHTVDLLLHKGYEVRILDSLQERVHPYGWPRHLPDDVEHRQGDVRDANTFLSALEGIDGVVHLAAYQDYMPDFSTFYEVNTVSTALLFELVVAHHLDVQKVVFASSQSVYGEGKYECEQCGVFYPDYRSEHQLSLGQWEILCPDCGAEGTPALIDETVVKPHTAYGISKYALELTARNLGGKYDIPTVCMRYSIVQGPRNSVYNAYSGIARIFTLRLLNDRPPICYEDGHQLRDYVYVGDVARANVLALEDERADNRAFNVAGQEGTTVLKVAHRLAKICGKDIEPEVSGEYRFGDTRHTVSTAQSLRELDWSAEVGHEEFLTQYVEWIREQPNLQDHYGQAEQTMRSAGVIRRRTSS
ncbi:MAG: NAD-dependent epimerase/dehydratase family protein [Candidatus Latescibacterota bacterium]|nr:NAD-dependent epimerase/dehydratase family protein [Candidatus Latescibacterota bacterium]